MRKTKLLLAVATIMFCGGTANAQVMIETDLTSMFNSLATTKWTGSSGQVGGAAPKVTTNSGLEVAAWENYCGDWNGGCTNTGMIMKTTVSGLTAGTYKIELYGAAAFTFNRGFGSDAFTGDPSVGGKATSDTYTAGQSIGSETGVFLYATTSVDTYSNEIPIWYADNFNNSGLSTVTLQGVVVGDDGNIEIGMSKTSQSTNWHVVQLKGVTATVDAVATFAVYKSEAEALYDSPMKASVLSELKSAANVDLTSAGADEYKTAIEALAALVVSAKASVANYAAAKAILDAANSYDEAGQANYAADETIQAIQAAYNDRSLETLTNEQKAAATAALATACKAQKQPADDSDMSPWIVNPNFDGNADGWTIEKRGNGWTGNPYNGGGFIEYWTGSTTDSNASGNFFDFYQTINDLPNGAYTITASLHNDTNDEKGATWDDAGCAGLYAATTSDEVIVLVTNNSNQYATYTTAECLVVDGTLRIGIKNVKPLSGRWFAADNFVLTYVRQLTNDEKADIEKANAMELYNEALAAAQAISEGTIPATAYNALQNTISSYTLSDGTAAEYSAAATALNEAAAAAEPLVKPYGAWKTLKNYADALKAVLNDNESANGTLASAIETQNGNAEASNVTADGITQAVTTLKAAMVTYVNVANPVGNGNKFDCTFMLTNPDLTGLPTWQKADGWYTEQTSGNSQVMTNGNATSADETKTAFFEYWLNPPVANNLFALYQKVTLPAGTYNMSCYAFAQYEQEGKHENIPNGVYFYANDVQGSAVNNARLSEQSIEFVNNDEQEVKIGLKPVEGNGNTWMGIGYVQLFKVPANTIELNEATAYVPESVAGTVKLTKTIQSGWNTVVLPFGVAADDVTEQFGAGTLYKYTGDNESGVLNFETVTAIDPHTPYLFNSTGTPKSEMTFAGVTISAGTPATAGTNFNFVGTYEPISSITANDYVLGATAFIKAKGGNALKAFRAYIQANEEQVPEARELLISIDGVITSIESIDGKKVNSNSAIYNLAGQKVNKAQKGIFIQDGKKFVK